MLRFRDFVSPEYSEKDMSFGQRLAAIVEAKAKGNVYLDFEKVQYLYAADIGKVVRVWKKLKDEYRRLVLCNVEPFVCELFRITRLFDLMEIRRSGPRVSSYNAQTPFSKISTRIAFRIVPDDQDW